MTTNGEEDYTKIISFLKSEIDVLKQEDIKIKKELFHTRIKKGEKETEIFEKEKLLQTYQIKNISKLIYQHIQKISNHELLSTDDIFKISKAIDKTDYTAFGCYPRFIDLETVVEYLIKVKQAYPLWTITNIRKSFKIETNPPKNLYGYEFTTPEGLVFSNVNINSKVNSE
jgi:hypothetical protein